MDGSNTEHYPGLTLHFTGDTLTGYHCKTAYFQGPEGVRTGMSLAEVLRHLPDYDGLFDQSPPAATESLYVLSFTTGALVQLQQNDGVWEASNIWGMRAVAVEDRYADLRRQGYLRRMPASDFLNPD